MPTKQIVILQQYVFREADYSKYGVDILGRNFQVIILDLTPWFRPDMWAKKGLLRYVCKGYRVINGYKEFESCACILRESIVIDPLDDTVFSRKLRIILDRWNVRRVSIRAGLIPNPTAPPPQAFINRFKKGSLTRRLFNKLKHKSNAWLFPNPPANIEILTGESRINFQSRKKSLYIKAHSFDYDTFLAAQKGSVDCLIPNNYSVFLDQGVVNHEDQEWSWDGETASEARYYQALNKFFDDFEILSGSRLVVAAHPKSRKDFILKNLPGQSVFFNRTAELVQHANVVFAHASTAVSFGVLWKKPLVCLTTDEIEKSILKYQIDSFAHELGCPIINLDHFNSHQVDTKKLAKIDQSRYEVYKRQYLKMPGSPDLPLWEIFSNHIVDIEDNSQKSKLSLNICYAAILVSIIKYSEKIKRMIGAVG